MTTSMEEFHQETPGSPENRSFSGKKVNARWSREAEKLLIEKWHEIHVRMCGANLSMKQWAEVSKSLKGFNSEYDYTVEQCRDKVQNLKRLYRILSEDDDNRYPLRRLALVNEEDHFREIFSAIGGYKKQRLAGTDTASLKNLFSTEDQKEGSSSDKRTKYKPRTQGKGKESVSGTPGVGVQHSNEEEDKKGSNFSELLGEVGHGNARHSFHDNEDNKCNDDIVNKSLVPYAQETPLQTPEGLPPSGNITLEIGSPPSFALSDINANASGAADASSLGGAHLSPSPSTSLIPNPSTVVFASSTVDTSKHPFLNAMQQTCSIANGSYSTPSSVVLSSKNTSPSSAIPGSDPRVFSIPNTPNPFVLTKPSVVHSHSPLLNTNISPHSPVNGFVSGLNAASIPHPVASASVRTDQPGSVHALQAQPMYASPVSSTPHQTSHCCVTAISTFTMLIERMQVAQMQRDSDDREFKRALLDNQMKFQLEMAKLFTECREKKRRRSSINNNIMKRKQSTAHSFSPPENKSAKSASD